ncbi:MAG: phage DNA encapsidation protein [Fibrobacter sp.]|nr:phage DNA encapsidation protein [Fibrobacter sp.]
MKNRKYWNRKPIFDTGAQIMMVFGQNSAGKSYQGKESDIVDWVLQGKTFFYLRRWAEDIKENACTSYFTDMPISEYTKGEWDSVVAWHGCFYFERYNEDGERERSTVIGYYGALNLWQRYKSNVYKNCDFIVFEEFISKDIYLDNEPDLLQKFMTIVFRDRPGCRVLMLGNAISRTCPYFLEWCPNVLKQKQGTIDIYHYHDSMGEGINIDIAVEYTGYIKGTGSMTFGKSSKTILGGEWDVENRPRLPKNRDLAYEKVYELSIIYQKFTFIVELLIDKEEGTKLVFVYPSTKGRTAERVITDQFSDRLMTTRYFRDIPAERYIMECIDSGRVAYSDNITASDFEGVYKMLDL